MDSALNNLQELMCHKTNQTKANKLRKCWYLFFVVFHLLNSFFVIYIYIYREREREWTWEQWQWRGAPYSPRPQHYWGLTIRLFSVISGHLLRSLTPLQKCSQCILQLKPTRQFLNLYFYSFKWSVSSIFSTDHPTLSAGAVEYTDCISVEG